jgi:glycosyltransferase involved in cell wall biosynthesis
MRKQKIAVFIDWYAPCFKGGGPVTSMVNMIETLKEYFDFHVVTSDTDYCESKPHPDIVPDRFRRLHGIRILYLSKFRKRCRMFGVLKRLKNDDTWYINGMYSRCYSLLPLLASRIFRVRRVVVAPRGMLSGQAFTAKSFRKKFTVKLLRFLGFYRNVTFHVTSEQECADVKRVMGDDCAVVVAGNLPRNLRGCEVSGREKHGGTLSLISVARISPEKNLLFALEALTHLNGQVTFDICGPIFNADYWEKCRQVIAALPENVKVNYLGSKNFTELRECFRQNDFLFLPSTGENFGHSILESLQNGCPVIISDRTPWRGLEAASAGWDLPLETDAFASVLQHCVGMDDEEYQRLRAGADSLWKAKLQPEKLLAAYLGMLRSDSKSREAADANYKNFTREG